MNQKSFLEAKRQFLSGDYKSADAFFAVNGCELESGYCNLLLGDFALAKTIFKKIEDHDLRADWASCLIQFIEGYVSVVPSYFQVRNFLEIDLNLLIQSGQAQFVENVINGADLFFSVNQESYKFIARVLLYNGYDGIARHYLLRAKDKFYYDPEMHLMLANSYLKSGDVNLAKQSIDACLGMLPDYWPAKKLLESIK